MELYRSLILSVCTTYRIGRVYEIVDASFEGDVVTTLLCSNPDR